MGKPIVLVVGIVAPIVLAVTLAACGGATKTPASSSPTASTATVTTLAGTAGATGSADGTGAAARFAYPLYIASDAAGNLYVTDHLSLTIRKVTPAGVVTTPAGKARAAGTADGTGAAARFNGPTGIACDAAGSLYVADTHNYTIRKITFGH
jgi:hypothetical protein